MEKSVLHDSIPSFLSIHVQPFWQLKHCPGVSGEYKHCQLIGFIFQLHTWINLRRNIICYGSSKLHCSS